MSENYEAAVEIREAISELTKEVKFTRLAIEANNKLIGQFIDQVIDPGAGEQFPGYIRMQFQDKH